VSAADKAGRRGGDKARAELEKVDRFVRLVDALNKSHLHDNAPEASNADAIEAIKAHLEWLELNEDEDDSAAVRLENVACLVAAALRYADWLMDQIPAELVEQIIAEHKPEVAT
jgi:hypothetical protein